MDSPSSHGRLKIRHLKQASASIADTAMPGFGECGVETRSALAVLDVVETVAALSTTEPSELARLNG